MNSMLVLAGLVCGFADPPADKWEPLSRKRHERWWWTITIGPRWARSFTAFTTHFTCRAVRREMVSCSAM